MRNARISRRLAATGLIALVAAGTSTVAGAHPDVAKWWQYDKGTWAHTWRDDPSLARDHTQWHRGHTTASYSQDRDEHQWLERRHVRMHFHQAISWQDGQTTWYDGRGLRGACGKRLVGLYAASRTLPCGSLVSVRYRGRYVLVPILDRGPYGSSSRILDLSPRAFRTLAPLGAGVIWIHSVRLKP